VNTRLSKVARDLSVRKGRSLLTLAGLLISLWGVGTVAIAWHVLSADLAQNFIRTQPPNLVVRSGRVGAQARAAIQAIDGVEAIEDRPLLMSRIENGPNAWLPMALFVVSDFEAIEVATFRAEEDAFPPPQGELIIERSGKTLMRFLRGQPPATRGSHGNNRHGNTGVSRATAAQPAREPDGSLKVRLPGGVEVGTRIAGTVFDPGLAPSTMERLVYGYVGADTAARWLGQPPDSRLLIRLSPGLQDLHSQRAKAAEIEAVLNAQGLEVDGVVYPPADEHPHQFQLNSILFLLGGVGALMLLLSVVLVVNLVTSLLSNQLRQVGALKAIGASTAQVSLMYLASLWLLGLAAALLALPLAVEAGYFVARFMAAMLNFEILTTRLPASRHALMVAAGSLFPVLAGLFPVRRWCSATVRDALDHHGAGQRAMQGSLIDRVRLPMPVNLRLGLRNSLRKPRRFLLSAATVATGALVFLVAMNLRSSLLHTADVEVASLNYDIAIGFSDPVDWDAISWIERFPAVDKVELWQAAAAQPLGLPAVEADSFTLVAVPEDTTAVRPNLAAGEWVSTDKPDGLVVSHRFLNHYPGLRIGDAVTLRANDRTFEVRLQGINKQFGPATLYLPEPRFLELTGAEPGRGRVARVMLSEQADVSTGEMIAMLEDHFDLFRQAGRPLKVSGVQTAKIASLIIRNHLDMIVWILGAMAALMLLVSGLGMASGIGTSVIERTRELGVLRAIGATPAMVRRILAAETLFIALVAWAISVALAPAASRAVSDYFGAGIVEYPFDYRTSVTGIWLSLGVVTALTLLATWGPARGAGRLAVSRAVAYE